MGSSELVSVLVRSMDRPTLERALAAVAQQTYPNIEVVVVAACGPGHRALPEQLGSTRVRLIVPETRLCRSDAANAGMHHAHGTWLVFLDDDDAMAPTHIETLVDAISMPPSVRLVHGRATLFDADGKPNGEFGGPRTPWLQYEYGFFQPGAALFARSLLDQGVRFDARFDILEDMDFWIQCARHTEFRYVDTATSFYYAESGTSGAGFGANSNQQRTSEALLRLRQKWADDVAAAEQTFEYQVHRGRELLTRGQARMAIEHLTRALALRPHQVDALNMFGVALLRTDAATAALDAFSKALISAPGHPQLLANRQLALTAMQRSG